MPQAPQRIQTIECCRSGAWRTPPRARTRCAALRCAALRCAARGGGQVIGSSACSTRTDPCLAVYPPGGARFQKHVDNTAGDGRRLTVTANKQTNLSNGHSNKRPFPTDTQTNKPIEQTHKQTNKQTDGRTRKGARQQRPRPLAQGDDECGCRVQRGSLCGYMWVHTCGPQCYRVLRRCSAT